MPPSKISAKPGQLSLNENPASGLAGSKVDSVAASDVRLTALSRPRQIGWAAKYSGPPKCAEQNNCYSRFEPIAMVCAKS